MPGFNQTGPLGQGPMTGRGLGPCNPQHGGGLGKAWGGMGRGLGRGFRGGGFGGGYRFVPDTAFRYADPASPQEALDALKQQRDIIDQRIAAMEKGTDEQ